MITETPHHHKKLWTTLNNVSGQPLRQPNRRGVAFFMIVFILLIVVVGTAKLFLRRELADLRSLARQNRSDVMNTAIDNVIASIPDGQPDAETLRWKLPLDPESTDSFLILWDAASSTWSATWTRRDTEIDSLSRPFH